jgi:hypothetical protein
MYQNPWPATWTGAQDVADSFSSTVMDMAPRDNELAVHSSSPPGTGWGALPRRVQVFIVLVGVIVGWWVLGRILPGDHVTKAHKAVAPNVAGSAVTVAAVGTV